MPPDDILQLRARAAAGDAEATAFTAVLAGLGAWEPQDWQVALQRLRAAADLGSASARDQLACLGDLAFWLAPAARRRLHPELRISEAADFLPPAACAWLIGRARDRLAPARVFDAAGAAQADAGRTNSAFEFGFRDLDLVVLAVRQRIAASAGVPTGALEPVQVLHYDPGQVFDRHYDFLDPAIPGHAEEIARAGQRIATVLVYLNDDYAGGATDFPLARLSYKGKAGDALLFANLDAAGAPERRTLHAGTAPETGEKWLLSQWIRDRARL